MDRLEYIISEVDKLKFKHFCKISLIINEGCILIMYEDDLKSNDEFYKDVTKAIESIKRKFDNNFAFFAESDLEMLYREGLII